MNTIWNVGALFVLYFKCVQMAVLSEAKESWPGGTRWLPRRWVGQGGSHVFRTVSVPAGVSASSKRGAASTAWCLPRGGCGAEGLCAAVSARSHCQPAA